MSFKACFENGTVTEDRGRHPCDGEDHKHYNYDWKVDVPDKLEEVESR